MRPSARRLARLLQSSAAATQQAASRLLASLLQYDEHRELLGYAKKGDGKTWESKMDYYTRMAGYVTLYAALLRRR